MVSRSFRIMFSFVSEVCCEWVVWLHPNHPFECSQPLDQYLYPSTISFSFTSKASFGKARVEMSCLPLNYWSIVNLVP